MDVAGFLEYVVREVLFVLVLVFEWSDVYFWKGSDHKAEEDLNANTYFIIGLSLSPILPSSWIMYYSAV